MVPLDEITGDEGMDIPEPIQKYTSEVAKMLNECAETYEQRFQVYGHNYKRIGAVMMALFPNGYEAQTEADWNRLGLLFQNVYKLTRYSTNF